jgi:hypothetical protein
MHGVAERRAMPPPHRPAGQVHYLRDRERGVVWEESIVLLPQSFRMIFLSATLPNCRPPT